MKGLGTEWTWDLKAVNKDRPSDHAMEGWKADRHRERGRPRWEWTKEEEHYTADGGKWVDDGFGGNGRKLRWPSLITDSIHDN